MTYYKPSEASIGATIESSQFPTEIVPDQHGINGRVGVPVVITGKLVYYDPTGGYGYAPLPNAPIHMYVEGNKVASTTTDSNGRFSIQYTFNKEGNYTIVLKFPGMTR